MSAAKAKLSIATYGYIYTTVRVVQGRLAYRRAFIGFNHHQRACQFISQALLIA